MRETAELTLAEQKQLNCSGEATFKFAKIRQRSLQKEIPGRVIGELALNITKHSEGFVFIDGRPYLTATRIGVKHFFHVRTTGNTP